jgi:hypothetical protein
MLTENEVVGDGVNMVVNVAEMPQAFHSQQRQHEATQDMLVPDQVSPERGQRDLLAVGDNFTG